MITIFLGNAGSSANSNTSLEFRSGNICTNLQHDGAAITFTGNCRLQGRLFQLTFGGGAADVGQAPDLTMSVYESHYDPTLSIASWGMTADQTMPSSVVAYGVTDFSGS